MVRGGRDTAEKLLRHAERTARAWCLDGQPLLGISVFVTPNDAVEGLLRRRFGNFRMIHVTTVGALRGEFQLLPTGQKPHYTIRLVTADVAEVERLLSLLGPAGHNEAYGQFESGPEEAP